MRNGETEQDCQQDARYYNPPCTSLASFLLVNRAIAHPSQPQKNVDMEMGMQETFHLAFMAQDKLSTQMCRSDLDLRFVVGHTNFAEAIEKGIVTALRDGSGTSSCRRSMCAAESAVRFDLSVIEEEEVHLSEAFDEKLRLEDGFAPHARATKYYPPSSDLDKEDDRTVVSVCESLEDDGSSSEDSDDSDRDQDASDDDDDFDGVPPTEQTSEPDRHMDASTAAHRSSSPTTEPPTNPPPTRYYTLRKAPPVPAAGRKQRIPRPCWIPWL